ncbi:hypothetical protein [Paenibacillus sp. USHLN196]|uniref:hypothetical protein n=1 Tax=Paenibacillus sp. USHLN196 TaxID=3081291 RepID=UPI003016981F
MNLIGFLLLAAALVLFFSSNNKLKRYVAYGLASVAVVTLVTTGLLMETGLKSKEVQGFGEKATVVEQVDTGEQQKLA